MDRINYGTLSISGNTSWETDRLNGSVGTRGMPLHLSSKTLGGRLSVRRMKDCFAERTDLCTTYNFDRNSSKGILNERRSI